MRNKKVLLTITLITIICIACVFSVYAHKGRTDSNGGHRDNDNQSGLGSYHYHCGGYPAHLHKNGVCPYTSYSSSSYADTSDDYDSGYEDDYDSGYEDGYNEGHNDGYDEGYDEGYDKAYYKGHKDGYNARIEDAATKRKKVYNFLLISTFVIVAIVMLVKFIKKHRK